MDDFLRYVSENFEHVFRCSHWLEPAGLPGGGGATFAVNVGVVACHVPEDWLSVLAASVPTAAM